VRKLLINNTVADLPNDVVIAITKQSNDLFDIQNKRTNLSNTIKLPVTATNSEIFGYVNDIASFDNQRNYYDIKYIQDYEEIISDGKAKLIGVSGGYFEIIIYYGNISLTEILGEKTLQDLDLDDLNDDWDLTNIAAETVTDELIYPIVNTHETEELRAGTVGEYLYAARFVPFVSIRRLFNQIMTDNGLTPVGDINQDVVTAEIESDLFIPVKKRDTAYTYGYDISVSNPDSYGVYASEIGVNPATIKELDEFIGSGGASFEFEDYFQSAETLTYDVKINQQIIIEFNGIDDLFYLLYLNSLEFNIIVWCETDNGTGTWQNLTNLVDIVSDSLGCVGINKVLSSGYATGVENRNYWLNLKETIDIGTIEFTRQLQTDEKIRFRMMIQSTLVNSGVFLGEYKVFISQAAGSSLYIRSTMVQFGEVFPIAKNLPDVKQIEFIKFLCAYYGYIIDVEDGTYNVRFEKIADVLNQTSEAIDISDNVQDFEITSIHAELSKRNVLEYTNDKDVGFIGRGFIDIDDDTLETESVIYSAPFSASANEFWVGHGVARYPLIKVWNEDFVNVGARIFKLQKATFDPAIYIGTSLATTTFTSKYIAVFANAQHFTNVLTARYSEYQELMNNYKEITVRCRFTANEFKAIDVLKLVYIQQLGGYFIIQMVKDYIDDTRLVEVVLLKV
jgi:hypothetical protein